MSSLPAGTNLLRRIYNLLWYPALPPALIATGGRDPLIRRERLGRGDFQLHARSTHRIWVHAASVGEIEAVRPVLRRLVAQRDDLDILVTTITVAGREAARRRLAGLATSRLAPLDMAVAVRHFLAGLRPDLILIAETELWPNFFYEGASAGARIALINGRLSTRSLARYRLVRGLFRPALARASTILVQTPADAARFEALGAPAERVIVTGNTKFDLDDTASVLRPALAGFAADHPLLVAGSTAPGEERIVLAAYRRLLRAAPSLALVVAPRHLERVPEVERELRAAGLGYRKASGLTDASGDQLRAATDVLLLDTMGELRAVYQRATIAFVGGSMLPPRGGQSLAEPATARIPVLFGPHYENHQEVGDALCQAGGGAIVHDDATLAAACARWLDDDHARRRAGTAARGTMERLAGGAAATVHHLLPLLRPR